MNIAAPCLRDARFFWAKISLLFVGSFAIDSLCLAQPFASDINRWKAQDAIEPPAPGGILFAGSSSIRRYEQLTRDFADYRIVQRGFGGSQFEDLNGYVNDIVLPYQPAAIVVFEGTNDTASGESSDEVFTDYQNFVNLVHTARPGTPIFFLGIAATPGRFSCCNARNIEVNTSIANFAATNPALHYVDLPTAFNAFNPPGGTDFLDLFADSIHLNPQGYDLWTSVIRPQLESVVAPNKVFTPNPLTPQPGSKILFDFGPSNASDGDPTLGPDANGNVWNNWHAAQRGVAINAGEHLHGLVDSTGAPAGVSMTITGGFITDGKRRGGLLAPDPALLGDFAIATATQDYFQSSADGVQGGGDDDRPGGFMLDGLDPNLVYDFRFFGSRVTTSTQIFDLRVTGANSAMTQHQTSGSNIGADGIYDANDDDIARVAGIRPDRFGQVFVDLTLVQGSAAFLSAMEVSVSVPEPASATTAVCLSAWFSTFCSRKRGVHREPLR